MLSYTGAVRSVETVTAGRNSPLSILLDADRGRWFVKGMPAETRWIATQEREFVISRHLHGAGPAARWRVHADGWHLIGFDRVAGRHADYRPGSPDLLRVAALLHRLSALPAPEGVGLRVAQQRLAEHTADAGDLAWFAGDRLVHTDLHPANVLVADAARLVDWGWATRGAAWLDAAYWTMWLITAGHTPRSAETTAGNVPAFRSASPAAVTAFAEANAHLWATIATGTTDPWSRHVSAAANAWAAHRHAVPA